MRNREAVAGYLFILPTVLGFLILFVVPMFWGLGLSFFKWDFFSSPEYVGITNFIILCHDKLFLTTLLNTTKFAFIATPLNVGLGMLIAIGINSIRWEWLKGFLRTGYFIPFVISSVVTAMLFQFMLHENTGVVNYLLSKIGVDKIPWLTSSKWAFISVIMVDVWKSVGFYVLIFLAGLQGVPRELYDAASVDGANSWMKMTRITIPLLTPTIFFSSIIALIGAFQVFDSMYVLTKGGPGDATRSIVMYLYRSAFGDFNMGFASSMAVFLFIIVLFFTIIQIIFSKRWVFYR